MFKTIIFDFDGTIADTWPKILELYNKYAAEFNLATLTRKEAEKIRGQSAFEIIKSFGISAIKIPGIANKIRNELNNSIIEVKIFDGIVKVFEVIKQRKLQLGLLTSNSQENVEKFLAFNKIVIFDFIHSEKNLMGKSVYLKKLISDFNLVKDQTIYIGDEVRDIDACRDNGIKIISVTWGFNTKEILQKNNPDYLINSPQKILEIVGQTDED